MIHFLLYILSVAFVLSLSGVFVYLAGRLVARDSSDLLRLSARSFIGGVDHAVTVGRGSRRKTGLLHLQVQAAGPQTGVGLGDLLPLQLPITTLGRSRDNNIVLADGQISGKHLSLSFERGGWWITDRGSSNGTRLYSVDGTSTQVADRPEVLSEGDVIEVGSVRLRLVP